MIELVSCELRAKPCPAFNSQLTTQVDRRRSTSGWREAGPTLSFVGPVCILRHANGP